jgi:hypothetical protein
MLRGRAPKSRYRQRAHAAQRQPRRMQQIRGELGREAVARRIAVKIGDQRIETASRRRVRRRLLRPMTRPSRQPCSL